MISIDRFEALLAELADELPEAFFEELNGGIVVDPGCPQHEAAVDHDLYILGQYRVDPALGKYIVLFYGSFAHVYPYLDEPALKEEMRRVLRHEFRHHVEGRAGMRDLEVWDAEQIAAYRARKKREE